MTLGTTLADLAHAREQAREIATSVQKEQRTLHDSMESFLESGWTGPAADEFASGWSEWNAAAAKVVDGLHAMSQLLDDVRVDYSTTDGGVHGDVTRLTARLGPQ